jgi:RsiW-degrading membrane proteinase PrsW (M82 family)
LAFLSLAVLPYVLLHSINPQDGVGKAAGLFTLYFAGIWFLAIRALVKPGPVSKGRLVSIILFTAFVGSSIAVTLERHLAGPTGSLFHNIIGVGFPEEFAKALPIFLFIFITRHKNLSPRTYLYIGAVSGLAFGAVEAITYSALYTSVLPLVGTTSYFTQQMWRLITDPVSHACMAGISCYFIGLAAHHRAKRVPLMALGLAIAGILHGAYDTTAGHWTGVAVAALIVFVFVGYALGAERIAHNYQVVNATTSPDVVEKKSAIVPTRGPLRASSPSGPAAGWYADPTEGRAWRWWDGHQWTRASAD